MPSSTGRPSGKRTGEMMADYAIESGPFLAACEALLTAGFQFNWYDRFPDIEHVATGQWSMPAHGSPAAIISAIAAAADC